MKKIYLFGALIAGLFSLNSCNNEPDFPGLDEAAKLENIITVEYTLEDADYTTISNNSANKTMAAAEGLANELKAVNTNKALSDEIPASKYAVILLKAKWYSAENGSSVWLTYNKGQEVVTDRFVYTDGVWNFDPSLVITLVSSQNNPESAPYYQAIVDWVAENKGTGYYQTGRTNTDYYYGASAYNCNFDFRIKSWRNSSVQGKIDYADLTDEQITALQIERLEEAFIPALQALHPDANVVSGLDVIYTINFVTYDGSNKNWTIQYKVTGKGQFEYVEGSLK